MTRIADIFARCKAAHRAAFIPFVMAGDPSAAATSEILDTLVKSGADIIELGIPFSDPMADGPVIQAAGLRALQAGMTLKGVLKLAAAFRARHEAVPLVLMGYLNPIHHYGYDAFARDAAQAGVDGVIIVDAPPEEAEEIETPLAKQNIALVRLVAPTSVPGRVAQLAKGAGGYLYYISITGITGAGAASPARVAEHITAIRQATALPLCVGFGIKTPDDVRAFASLADGVVVGSAIVAQIEKTGGDAKKLAEFTAPLAKACGRGK